MSKEATEEDYQKSLNQNNMFQSSNRRDNNKTGTTNRQKEIAKKWGISSERSKELRKKHGY